MCIFVLFEGVEETLYCPNQNYLKNDRAFSSIILYIIVKLTSNMYILFAVKIITY